jgi:hypothetical protein
MLQLSVESRNAQLDAIEASIGTSPVLLLRTGTQPATAGTADSGTVLVTINLPSDWMNPAANGSKTMAGSWADNSADAGGFAGHYRIYKSDGVTCMLQGPVAMAWFPDTQYAAGHRAVNGANIYVATVGGTTASSGGPTGTGNSIVDNGVTWSYVSNAVGAMVMDNNNLAVGQPFTVSSYTWTAGNA